MVTLFQDWAGALAERVSTGATLAMAETRLAISTFLLMVFVSVLAAGAILFAWGLLVFASLHILVANGVSNVVAALVLVLVHAGLAWALWQTANSLMRNLEFTETRRLLRSAVGSRGDESAAVDE
jgi:hypothetical protein